MAHPKRSFHLIDAYDGTDGITKVTFMGRTMVNGHIRIFPFEAEINTDYILGEENNPDDDVFIKSLQDYEMKLGYSKNLEDRLNRYGIKYRIERCKACGGRTKAIYFHPIEVVL